MPESIQAALDTMESALRLLDETDAPAHIGAHLDLAICRLEELISFRSVPELLLVTN